jgi:hypothetical protein
MQKEIYIYGAGYYGVLTALDLENRSVKVNGFIDKNANAIKTRLGLPVLELSEIESKSSRIVIAVQNEGAIKEITEALSLHGFKFEISLLVQKCLKTTIIYMANDTRYRGGWTDRLSAMLGLYRIAKDNGFDFKINFTKPFNLLDFIIPNKYDWRIDENDVLFSEENISVSMFIRSIRDLYPETQFCKDRSEFEKKLLDLKGKYRQIHCYCGTLRPQVHGRWIELFNELFVLTDELKERIDFHRQKMNSQYVSAVFRFQQLLGDDFGEGSQYPTLAECEQNNLIEMCINNLKIILDSEKDKIVLVCADSTRFREAIKDIKNIYVVDGPRKHPNLDFIDKEIQMLSFIDFFLIPFGEKTYCFAPKPLYKSGFPQIASIFGKVPFQYIERDLTKPLLKKGDINADLKSNSIILDYLKNEKTEIFSLQEKEEIIECLTNSPFSVCPYRFAKEKRDFEVFYDDSCDMFFVLRKGKKLYFPQDWTEDKVKKYYNGLLIEQDYRSPHCYKSEGFEVDRNDIIADIGAAEGIWALDNVETAKFAYIFECNRNYIRALHKTFEPYKMKVRIVNKYVSIFTENNNIAIDDFIAESGADISFIKADIEGEEMRMLGGATTLLETSRNLRLLLCTYHNQSDAAEFEFFLKKHKYFTEFSNGVMLFIYDRLGLQEPYFRKGLIRAKKICSKSLLSH